LQEYEVLHTLWHASLYKVWNCKLVMKLLWIVFGLIYISYDFYVLQKSSTVSGCGKQTSSLKFIILKPSTDVHLPMATPSWPGRNICWQSTSTLKIFRNYFLPCTLIVCRSMKSCIHSDMQVCIKFGIARSCTLLMCNLPLFYAFCYLWDLQCFTWEYFCCFE
jgi:hypothetical protein